MMKHTKLILTLLCLVLFSGMAQAQGNDASTPITQADLGGRKALVGPGCIVNQFATNVQLLSGITGLENLVDEDLDNYATFTTGAGVGVTEQPLFSVKDMYNTYAAGTEAGICMVSSQSGGLLSLSVISLFSILVYNDGELVETISDLTGGQAGSGVALDLIKIPGSDNLSVNLTCTPQHDFDELYVVQSGGLDVSVIKQLKFKYAFVGEPRQCLMVNDESDKLDNDIADYAKASGRGVSGKTPTVTPQASCTTVLFPTPTVDADNLADDNLDNGTQIISVLSIAYKGSAKVSTDPKEPICGIKNRNPEPTVTFPAGSEVGFVYTNGSALNLSLGNAVQLKIYNTDGTTQTENIEAGVLSLGVAEGGKMTSSAIAEKEFYAFEIGFYAGLNADVGDISVHYGFVNEPAIVPHRCDINPSVDSDICDVQGTYQLLSNPSVGVEWTLESAYELDGTTPLPAGAVTVTPSGKVTFNDIIDNGIFTFKATAVGCTHAPKCTAKMVLRRGINTSDSGCSDPIYNKKGAKKYALSEDIHDPSGSLISISDIEHSEYILDDNLNNYATYTGGLSLASNIHVIGVKTNDDSDFATSTETDGKKVNKRIGFIVESESTFLNADVLQFFQIRCYKEGDEVYRQLVDESNAVGVGLIEEAQSQKMRFSIEVPADIDFDEFALWTAGVLKLDISTLRIYYPFIEDNSLDCANPLKCATPITAKDGASAYPEMKFQTASIAGVVQNLGNLIDDDMDTYFRYQNTVQAGSGMVVSVKLGKTLDYRHQFGIVMDTETFLAGVGLGTWMTVETYYNGQPTGDKFDNWGVLGLNLIGYGDKSYLVNTPTRNFDEIRITFAGVANVLNSNKLYGIFFRSDKNLNGIPDCMDPDQNCAEDLDLKTTNVCVGENMVLTGKVQGASEGYQIVVKAPEQDSPEQGSPEQGFEKLITIEDPNNPTFSVEIPTTKPGTGLNVMVYADNGRFLDGTTYVVHPLRTTWRKTPINTDWNEPNNWEGNVNPYCCTDVIIPDGATLYPVLQSVDPDSKAPLADNYYCCNGIYFQASPDGDEDNPAQIVNVPQLAYHKAWVDVRMMPNRYYMFSAPLRNTLTGDLFVPAEMNGQLTGLEFEDLGDDNAKQNRFNPRVFQRMWKSNPQVRWLDHIYYGGNDGTTEKRQDKWSDAGLEDTKSQMADWSKHFNAMQQAYSYTQGFSVWMDNGDLPADQAIITRLPKQNTYYNYYTPDGDELPEHDGIIGSDDLHDYDKYTDATKLNRSNNTRFIYEQKDYEEELTYADKKGENTDRYGAKKGDNPFDPITGELSIKATTEESTNNFVVGNMFMSDIDIKTFLEVNKENVKALRRYNGNTYETYALTDGNTLLTTMAADESDNEMEEAAVKERKKVIHPLESFFIDLAEEHSGTRVNVKFTPDMMTNTVAEKDEATTEQATIRLTAEVGGKRSAMIVSGAETGINMETMLDADVKPSAAIFAAIDGKAQDITSTDLAQIPLGIIAENDTLTFHATAEGGMDISEWELVDLSDGRSYSIDTPVTFTNVGNSVGRFILRSQSSTTGIESPESHSVYVKAQGDKATITTIQGDIASVEVFTTAGVLYARAEATGSSCTVNIPTGQVAIVHVTLSDGNEESVKVLSTRR